MCSMNASHDLWFTVCSDWHAMVQASCGRHLLSVCITDDTIPLPKLYKTIFSVRTKLIRNDAKIYAADKLI